MSIKRFHYLFISLVAVYLLIVTITPVDPATIQKYNVSEFQLRLIGLSISIPIAIIWLVALYGYTRFKSYALTIRDAKEGPAFQTISNGLMVLVLGLPLNAIIGSLLRRLSVIDPSLLAATTITRSYVTVAIQLVAFALLAAGAAQLVKTAGPKTPVVFTRTAMLIIITLIAGYTWLVIARPFGGSIGRAYMMPEWLVLLTIVIPYLFAWSNGLLAAHYLQIYGRKVKGRLYKQMLKNIVIGLWAIIGLSISVQLFVSLSDQLTRLNFTPILIIVYILIALHAVGYGLLARGARQLKKIEEV